jgi:hypothetical protein
MSVSLVLYRNPVSRGCIAHGMLEEVSAACVERCNARPAARRMLEQHDKYFVQMNAQA